MSMRNSCLVGALVLLLGPFTLFAAHPEHVIVSTFDQFQKGDGEGIAITSDGKLMMAPAFTEQIDTKEAFIYSAVVNQSGTAFFGTGNNGKIFRLPTSGPGGELAKLEEAGVYALAVDSANQLYAATGPDGKVYKIGVDGKAEVFYEPGQKYIWDLAFDAGNNLYVATGPSGVIYKVTPDGKGTEFYDSEETHIVSLAWDLSQNLVAGTAPGGLVVRLTRDGKPFVLLDTDLEEVKAVDVDRYGNLFVVALSGGGKPSAEVSTASNQSSKSSDSSEESTVEVAGKAKGAKLEIYQIDKNNGVERRYSSSDELAFDILVQSNGSLLVATGNEGRILAVSPQGFVTVLVDSVEEQVTKLIEIGGVVYGVTSNLGKVFRLETRPSDKGIYLSEVLDAKVLATWGTIRWEVSEATAKDAIRLFTRAGNTEKPDRTWSDWQGPYSTSEGSKIQSVPSRYLQWKVEFGPEARSEVLLTQNNAVEHVAVTYLQANVAPSLTSLTVHAPGIALMKFPQANASGGVSPGGPDGAHSASLPSAIRDLETPTVVIPLRKLFVPGSRSFSWKADDANDDLLIYSVYLQREGTTKWALLAKDFEDSHYVMDGLSHPDGVFKVKVVASDRKSNPADRALETQLISQPFLISNAAPAISWKPAEVSGSGAKLSFTASSSGAYLYQAEYSVDGGPWQIVFASDGITDQKTENYDFDLKDLKSGSHTVYVRVVDLVGNLGVSEQAVSVP